MFGEVVQAHDEYLNTVYIHIYIYSLISAIYIYIYSLIYVNSIYIYTVIYVIYRLYGTHYSHITWGTSMMNYR
jgi:hypothetical protein